VFEIGIWQGGSLNLWKSYFGPNARIVGIDIERECLAIEEDQIAIRIGDQSDPAFLSSLVDEFGAPDIVIDDGRPQTGHINPTFDFLYPKQPKNSVYVVEDTFLGYRDEWRSKDNRRSSFIERTKDMIDLLHAHYRGVNVEKNDFANSTLGIHIYDAIIVFEKQSINRRVAVTGAKQIHGPQVENAQLERYFSKAFHRE